MRPKWEQRGWRPTGKSGLSGPQLGQTLIPEQGLPDIFQTPPLQTASMPSLPSLAAAKSNESEKCKTLPSLPWRSFAAANGRQSQNPTPLQPLPQGQSKAITGPVTGRGLLSLTVSLSNFGGADCHLSQKRQIIPQKSAQWDIAQKEADLSMRQIQMSMPGPRFQQSTRSRSGDHHAVDSQSLMLSTGRFSRPSGTFRRHRDLWETMDTSLYGGEALGVTQLHRLCFSCNLVPEKSVPFCLQTVEALICLRADLNGGGGVNACTPLHALARQSCALAPALIELLIKAHANPELGDRKGATPLQLAVRAGHIVNVRTFAKCGAEVDAVILEAAKMKSSESVLIQGSSEGHIQHICYALFAGDVVANAMGDADRCAGLRKFKSLAEMHAEDVRKLLALGDDKEAATHTGSTQLWVACSIGKLETAIVLLEAMANVDAADFQGRTALHAAAQRGDLTVATWLMYHKASLDAEDCMLRTPLAYAATEKVRALLSPGKALQLQACPSAKNVSELLNFLSTKRCRDLIWVCTEDIHAGQAAAANLWPQMSQLLERWKLEVDDARGDAEKALRHLLDVTRGPEPSCPNDFDNRHLYREQMTTAVDEVLCSLTDQYRKAYLQSIVGNEGCTTLPKEMWYPEALGIDRGQPRQDSAHGVQGWLQDNSLVEMFLALRSIDAVTSLQEYMCFLRDTEEELIWQHAYCKWLCQIAQQVDPVFHKVARTTQKSFPNTEYLQGPPKKFSRIIEKLEVLRIFNAKDVFQQGKYGFKTVPGYVTDLVRSTIVCPDLPTLLSVRNKLLQLSLAREGAAIVMEKNGFSEEHDKYEFYSGYRDWKCLLVVDSGKSIRASTIKNASVRLASPSGQASKSRCRMICELQLSVRSFMNVMDVSHLIFDIQRGFFETAAYRRRASEDMFEECGRITKGSPNFLKSCLQRTADPNFKAGDGTTCLLRACFHARRNPGQEGQFDVMEFLLKKVADPNFQSGRTRITPLHVVASTNHGSAAKAWQLLVEHSAQVDVRDRDDRTPLSIVTAHHPHIAEAIALDEATATVRDMIRGSRNQ